MPDVTFLSHEDVENSAEVAEYVGAVKEAYRQRGEGGAAEPRTKLTREDPSGMLTSYLAILPDSGVMGGYVYAAGFDSGTMFVTPLYDAEEGRLLALIDGAHMNPYKTGAAGAVGVDSLAREDSSVLGFVGAGSQARGQLRAVAEVRDLADVKVFSRTPESRESFADEFDDQLSADVRPVESSAAAVEDSDVVVTATTSYEPVFDGDRLSPGTHVTAMGQYHPERRELDATTIERAKYVPDLRERIHSDAGSFILAREEGAVDDDHVHAELGDVVAGTAPGRTSSEEVTVFDSGGNAIETVAAANLLYEKADPDAGTELPYATSNDAFPGR
ncbi:Ornithine cyclodeaminase (plasmid) [halophilic archaeon DL31]|nr:Ornithine cyclodeaminase [halophilic archaeon DL31]